MNHLDNSTEPEANRTVTSALLSTLSSYNRELQKQVMRSCNFPSNRVIDRLSITRETVAHSSQQYSADLETMTLEVFDSLRREDLDVISLSFSLLSRLVDILSESINIPWLMMEVHEDDKDLAKDFIDMIDVLMRGVGLLVSTCNLVSHYMKEYFGGYGEWSGDMDVRWLTSDRARNRPCNCIMSSKYLWLMTRSYFLL